MVAATNGNILDRAVKIELLVKVNVTDLKRGYFSNKVEIYKFC